MAERVVRTLASLGVERALVFFGHDGLDELTVTTTSTVYELEQGEVRIYDVDPVDLGIPRAELGALAGGDASGNAQAVHQVFAGASGPIRDIVTLNSAAALFVADAVARSRGRRRASSSRDRRREGRGHARSVRAGRRRGARRGCRLMARALECPACGAKHRIDNLPDSPTFRCDRCGQVLKMPPPVTTGGPPPPARSPGAAPVVPPPRRRAAGGAPAGAEPATATAGREPSTRQVAGVSATVGAVDAGGDSSQPTGRGRRAPTAPAKGSKVSWYWRAVAWILAVPLGFVITAWPAYSLGFIKKDDVLNIFVGTGTGRYVRLAIGTLVWALVTALLVQLFVEGGRAWVARRRVRAATA